MTKKQQQRSRISCTPSMQMLINLPVYPCIHPFVHLSIPFFYLLIIVHSQPSLRAAVFFYLRPGMPNCSQLAFFSPFLFLLLLFCFWSFFSCLCLLCKLGALDRFCSPFLLKKEKKLTSLPPSLQSNMNKPAGD